MPAQVTDIEVLPSDTLQMGAKSLEQNGYLIFGSGERAQQIEDVLKHRLARTALVQVVEDVGCISDALEDRLLIPGCLKGIVILGEMRITKSNGEYGGVSTPVTNIREQCKKYQPQIPIIVDHGDEDLDFLDCVVGG